MWTRQQLDQRLPSRYLSKKKFNEESIQIEWDDIFFIFKKDVYFILNSKKFQYVQYHLWILQISK